MKKFFLFAAIIVVAGASFYLSLKNEKTERLPDATIDVVIANDALSILKEALPDDVFNDGRVQAAFSQLDHADLSAENVRVQTLAYLDSMLAEQGRLGFMTPGGYISMLYMGGIGVPANERRAFEAAKYYAEKGDAGAAYMIAYIRMNRALTDSSMTFSEKLTPAQALAYIQKLSDERNIHAQILLYNCYIDHVGVEADEAKAQALLEEFVRQGNPIAQYVTALQLLEQNENAPRDEEKIMRGIELLYAAAKQYHPDALSNLGYRYVGGIDVERDIPAGFELLRRAQKIGSMEADAFLLRYKESDF